MKIFKRVPPSVSNVAVEQALGDELRALRDENARLRVQLHRPPALGVSAPGRMRALAAEVDELVALQESAAAASRVPGASPVSEPDVSDASDDAWQTLADALVIRDALVAVCDELIDASARLRRRLQAIGIPHAGAAPEDASPGDRRVLAEGARR